MKHIIDASGMKSDLRMMTWEVSPKRRKDTGNPITLNVKNTLDLSVGTGIKVGFDPKDVKKHSVWRIEEIVKRQPSSLSGYDNITALASWSYENL